MPNVRKRIFWAFVLAGCVAVLTTARCLVPDPRGLGTHVQLTRGRCLFDRIAGIPCATCGMTTSFAHATRLQMKKALAAQPFGALLCVVVAALVPLAVFFLIKGCGPGLCIPPDWALGLILVFLIAGWTYKILTSSGVM